MRVAQWSEQKKKSIFIADFGELYLMFQNPDDKKKGISEIGREPTFNEDLKQREFKFVDHVGT